MSAFRSTWLQRENMGSVGYVSPTSEIIPTEPPESLAVSDAIELRNNLEMSPEDFQSVLRVFQMLRRWRNESNPLGDTLKG